MSGKIYWGRPGSYKTSSAVKNDLPEFALEGRIVITNIRGLNDTEKVKKVIEKEFKKNVPDSFQIINIDSESKEGKYLWATFFHWAPKGCAFIVDEAQAVWPKKWNQKYLDTLNYPKGADEAKKDGRPLDFNIAFDQHRHYNWDFVLTTPHIKKIRDDIKEICDFAYKHRNQALVGIKNKYNQFGHDPDNNCRTEKDEDVARYGLSIPPWVFDMYESTTTGEVRDTRSGFTFWKQPKIILLGLMFLLFWGYALTHVDDLYARFSGDQKEEVEKTNTNSDTKKNKEQKVAPSNNKYFGDLGNLRIYYAGRIKSDGIDTFLFNVELEDEKEGTIVDEKFFQSLGYAVIEINRNMVLLGNKTEKYYVKTRGKRNDKKMF